MARRHQRHISGWPAVLLAPFVIPAILSIKLGERLFGLKRTVDLTDWDDFTCIPITDPSFDQIREEAAFVQLPLNDDGRATLRELLARVRAM
jgi:hypothetical protein